MKDFKNNKGITLIALVITIIVLLILAGVTISTLTGENGLITKASDAKNSTRQVELEEEVKLAFQEHEIDKHTNPNASLENSLKSIFEKINGTGNIDVAKSGKNYKVKVKDSKTCYRVRYDGTIEKYEEMSPTNMYAKLDDDGTLHLRATQLEGYNTYINSDSIQSNWNTTGDATRSSVIKIIVEEPIAPRGVSQMFFNFNKLTSIENIENLHTENMTAMDSMFQGCSLLENLDLSKFDTENVTNMLRMFEGLGAKNTLDLSGFNTSKVTTMYDMFYGCKCEKIDVSGFDTSKITTMEGMFGFSKFKELNLKTFNTDRVSNMYIMFIGCSQLEKLNISGSFQISEGTNIAHMFTDANGNMKIISSQDTKSKITEIFPRLKDNFEIN